MSKNIKIKRLSNKQQSILEKTLNNNLKLHNFQLYNPILKHYFNFYNNNSYKYYTFDSKYNLYNLKDSLLPKNKDTYIKHIYSAKVKNNYTKKLEDRNVFIKVCSILETSQYIQHLYNLNHNSGLPNYYHNQANRKINDSNNSAYIDGFSSFILGKLVETGACPSFPLYYGSFSGIMDKFKFDITEDYNSIKHMSWFKRYNNNKFDIEMESYDNFSDIIKELLISGSSDDLEFDTLSDDSSVCSDSSDRSNRSDRSNSSDTFTDIESCSDISINSLLDINKVKYCNFKNYPVHLTCMQSFDDTLDNLLDDGYDMTNTEWKSILFQICFALAVAQKKYNFIHNDLHSSNIMFETTTQKFIYYKVNNKLFKIPTFNKLCKIIDFGRATFIIDKHVYFSDVFKRDGDAEGQYDYPYNNYFKNCKIRPNPSFDLARLATTIYERFEDDSELIDLMEKWTTDDHGLVLLGECDDFDLYRNIGTNVHSALPRKQLDNVIFKQFIIDNQTLKKEQIFVY